MKLITKILAALALILCVSTVRAQSGFNVYEGFRTTVVAPQTLSSGSGAGIVTNWPVDLHGFEGVASLILTVGTNVGGGTLTCSVETSPDLTNWTALGSYSLASPTVVKYTNTFYGGTSLIATNVYLLPGTITTPTASSAGFATQYLNPAPYTNSGSINVINTNGVTVVGFNIQDTQRFMHVYWTPGGTVTNYISSAVLVARKQQFP